MPAHPTAPPRRRGHHDPGPGSLSTRAPQRQCAAPLPPGTHVVRLIGGQHGVVQKYGVHYSCGPFPVRWVGGLWEIVAADDVAVIQQAVAA